MSVIEHNGLLKIVRLEVNPTEIPALLEMHRQEWEPPGRLEAEARDLCAANFPDKQSMDFAEKVMQWGRVKRVFGKFHKLNTPADVAGSLRTATAKADFGLVPEAVFEISELNNVGLSVASKLLRFLRPSQAVILDKVIRGSLGFTEDKSGYSQFLSDCQSILEVARITDPHLRICDVEAAIFAKIQGY